MKVVTFSLPMDHMPYAVKEIKIYPIDMGFQKVIAQRGRPVLAEGESAQWSLERLKEASKVFGTEIKIEGDIGYIRL